MATEKKKVLIIEDERSMARALEIKLEQEGFEAESLDNGSGVMDRLQEGFDLLISDLMMPDVDGFDVLRMAREKYANLLIMVLTNLSQKEEENKTKELGTEHFFIKSNTPISDIVMQVKKLLA